MALSPEVILVALRENVSYVTSRDPNKSTLGKNRRPGNPDRFSCPSELPAAKYDRHASNGERPLSVRFPVLEIVSGSVTNVEQIATRQRCSVRQVNMTISLAFLAPGLVKAAVEGRLPRGIGVERLRDAAPEWKHQFETLGLNPN
jgi:hypothetical protein